jgi:UDP-perosamine 4-acetyltransferase
MNDRKNIAVFGAGNQGRVALEVFHAAGRRVAAFLDDGKSATHAEISGTPVHKPAEFFAQHTPDDVEVFIAVGNAETRITIGNKLRAEGYSIADAVHPSAILSSTAKLGRGVLVCAGAFVGVDATLCDYAVLNTGGSIDHDGVIGLGAYVAPGVTSAGDVHIGEKSFVGVGAVLGPNVVIGDEAVVAAGSVVLGHVSPGTMVAGAPARLVRKLQTPLNWSRLLAAEPKPIA